MTVGELIERLKKEPYPDRVLVDSDGNLISGYYTQVYSPELKRIIECQPGMENYGEENIHMVGVLTKIHKKVAEEDLHVREEREKTERLRKACQNAVTIGDTTYINYNG